MSGTPLPPRCDLTDLYVDQCAHCLGHTDAPPVLTDVEVAQRFPARYEGLCANCGMSWRRGEIIGRLVDSSGYVCGKCLP